MYENDNQDQEYKQEQPGETPQEQVPNTAEMGDGEQETASADTQNNGEPNRPNDNPYNRYSESHGENPYGGPRHENPYGGPRYENPYGGPNGGYGRPADMYYEGEPKGTGFAVASLVLGILGVVCCCAWYLSLIFGILSIVFAVVNKKQNGKMSGMALAGLICGIVGVVMVVVVGVFDMMLLRDPEFMQWYNDMMNEMYGDLGTENPDMNV